MLRVGGWCDGGMSTSTVLVVGGSIIVQYIYGIDRDRDGMHSNYSKYDAMRRNNRISRMNVE